MLLFIDPEDRGLAFDLYRKTGNEHFRSLTENGFTHTNDEETYKNIISTMFAIPPERAKDMSFSTFLALGGSRTNA